MSTVNAIAGVPISPRTLPQWELSVGVEPFQKIFNVERKRGLSIFNKFGGEPTTIQIGEEVYSNVYVTSTTAGSDRHHIGLIVQDSRWLWPATIIQRGYNVRQRTGEVQRKPAADNKDLIENVRLINDVKYFEWSLNGEIPWTLAEAFRDVFNAMGIFQFIADDLSKRSIPLEDFEEPEALTADQMLARLLQYAPGFAITLLPDGTPLVFDRTDNSEVAVVDSLPPPIQGTGWIELANRKFERPMKVEVYLTIEQEVRFDYTEPSNNTTVAPQVRGREEPTLENILPIPTKSLTFPDGVELFEGSWITFAKLFTAIDIDTNDPGGRVKLSSYLDEFNNDAIRRAYLTPVQLENRFIKDPNNEEPIRFWADIIHGALENWRRTFRITKPWRDRIRSYRANRVGIVSEETRSRAPARAYTSYSVQPTKRMYHQANVGPRYKQGWTFDGYREDLSDPEAIPAPSIIKVPDQDNGILKVVLKTGPYGEEEKVIPGIPEQLPEIYGAGHFRDVILTNDEVSLEEGWQMAVVLTVVKAAPNNSGNLHKVEVTPQEAESFLGSQIGECRGPVLQVKVVASPTTTARFIWDDARADEIKESFFTGAPMPEELLNNREHVEHIAKATAASVYSALLDRHEGGYDFSQRSSVKGLVPTGSIGKISQRTTPKSTVRTRVELPRIFEQQDFLAYLPAETKRAVMGVVQP